MRSNKRTVQAPLYGVSDDCVTPVVEDMVYVNAIDNSLHGTMPGSWFGNVTDGTGGKKVMFETTKDTLSYT